jgi:hypothetical protein
MDVLEYMVLSNAIIYAYLSETDSKEVVKATQKENLKLKWIRNSKRWEEKKKKTVNTRDCFVVCFSKELIMQKLVS